MTSVISDNPGEAWRRGLGGVLDSVSQSHGRAVVILIVLSLLAFLPGFGRIPPVDRDEARFAQATKQMVTSGDYIDIRFQDDVRYKKPVGIYWLQAASVKAALFVGRSDAVTRISVYRLPSMIGAIGAVLLTYWTALAFMRRRAAIVAALMMVASVILGIEARLAKTDAVLLMTVIAAMGVLARAYLGRMGEYAAGYRRFVLPLIFWGALAAGFLVKGPLVLMFVGLPILTLCFIDRSVRWVMRLNPLLGIPVFLLIVMPWFVAIWGRSGAAFFEESAGRDMFGKIFQGQESHGAPPGYFIVLFFVTFFPASLLAGLAAPAVWRGRRETPVKFLLCWLVPAWVVFELVVTKLPHYVLPLYPAIAILIAGCVDTHRLSKTRWMEHGTFWWFAVPAVAAVLSLVFLLRYQTDIGWRAWPFFAASIVFGFRAWWLYDVDGAERSLLRACVASVLMSVAIFWSVIPRLASFFPSAFVARTIQAADCSNPMVAAAGYQEPSLVFLAGTDTLLTDATGAADFLKRGACRFAVVEASQDRYFVRRAEAIGLRYTKEAQFVGLNLGSSSRNTLTIYRSNNP